MYVFALEGLYINPEGFCFTLLFRSNGKVKVSSQTLDLPITYNYSQKGSYIYIEDPSKGQVELQIRGNTLWTDAPFMDGTYYREGSQELKKAKKKIEEDKLKKEAEENKKLEKERQLENSNESTENHDDQVNELKSLLHKLKSDQNIPKEEIIKILEKYLDK